MDNLCTPKGRYPEVFMLISLFEVCQEGAGGQEVGTRMMLGAPDQTHGGQGHP